VTTNTKLEHCKTTGKKQQKRYVIPKAVSDPVLIVPSQFVMENQGALSNIYQFKKQLGQGTSFY
jgi:hypothetical protein